jgi:hypothetical protein
MTANRIQPRRISVANVLTAIVAAWFVIGMGSIVAEAAQPAGAAPAQAKSGAVSLTSDGRMKLTEVAKRERTSQTQVAATARAAKG